MAVASQINLASTEQIVLRLMHYGVPSWEALRKLALTKRWVEVLYKREGKAALDLIPGPPEREAILAARPLELRAFEPDEMAALLRLSVSRPHYFEQLAALTEVMPRDVLLMIIELDLPDLFVLVQSKRFYLKRPSAAMLPHQLGWQTLVRFQRSGLLSKIRTEDKLLWAKNTEEGAWLLKGALLPGESALLAPKITTDPFMSQLVCALHLPEVKIEERITAYCFSYILEHDFRPEMLLVDRRELRDIAWSFAKRDRHMRLICSDGKVEMERCHLKRCTLWPQDPWVDSLDTELNQAEARALVDFLEWKRLDDPLEGLRAGCVAGVRSLAEEAAKRCASDLRLCSRTPCSRTLCSRTFEPHAMNRISTLSAWGDELILLPELLRDWVMSAMCLASIPPWVKPRSMTPQELRQVMELSPSDAVLRRALPHIDNKHLLAKWCAEKGYPLSMTLLLDCKLTSLSGSSLLSKLTRQGKIVGSDLGRAQVLALFPDVVSSTRQVRDAAAAGMKHLATEMLRRVDLSEVKASLARLSEWTDKIPEGLPGEVRRALSLSTAREWDPSGDTRALVVAGELFAVQGWPFETLSLPELKIGGVERDVAELLTLEPRRLAARLRKNPSLGMPALRQALLRDDYRARVIAKTCRLERAAKRLCKELGRVY